MADVRFRRIEIHPPFLTMGGTKVYFLNPDRHEVMAAQLTTNDYPVRFTGLNIVIDGKTGGQITLAGIEAMPGMFAAVYTSRITERCLEESMEKALFASGGGFASAEQMKKLAELSSTNQD